MATQTKRFDLISKTEDGGAITSETVKIGPDVGWSNSGFFYDSSPLNNSILDKVEVNFRCKSGSGQIIDIGIMDNRHPSGHTYNFRFEHNLVANWNKAESALDGLYGNSTIDKHITIEPGNTSDGGRDIEVYTHNSSYKPYAIITYRDGHPGKPTSLYPSNTAVSAKSTIRFSWAHKSPGKDPQEGFTLQYSMDNGANWITISRKTEDEFYNMPADTLPIGTEIKWRVKTEDVGSWLESDFSDAQFNTASVPPLAPILLSPLNRYLDGTKEIAFSWSFVGGVAEDTQGKYELQYSLSSGSTWYTITEENSNQEYTVPENTFPSANIYWRVKTYNTYGDESPYSEMGSFYVINSPPLPQIQNVTNSSRPTITWISTEQETYEIEILQNNKLILETGTIPSPRDKSYRVNRFLDDGLYLARLRIENEYNLFSDWAEINFTISTEKPAKPDIAVFGGGYGVIIKVINTDLEARIYRDEVYIGKAINGSFADYAGENKREHKYFARVIDNNDNFNDSEIKLGRCKFGGNTLALASNPSDFIKLKYGLDSNIVKSNQFTVDTTLQNYDGRKYPVAEHGEFESKSKSLTFYLRTKEDLIRLIEMIQKRKTLLYRNRDGSNIYGSISSVDYDENETFWGYGASFTITCTDYRGENYD